MGDRQSGSGIIATHQSVVSYESPLPPAAEFERYERAHPGAAAKLIEWAEDESEHRRASESRMIDIAARLNFRGQTFAFVIAILALAVTAVCAFLNQAVVAVVPAILGCISLAAVFLGKKN